MDIYTALTHGQRPSPARVSRRSSSRAMTPTPVDDSPRQTRAGAKRAEPATASPNLPGHRSKRIVLKRQGDGSSLLSGTLAVGAGAQAMAAGTSADGSAGPEGNVDPANEVAGRGTPAPTAPVVPAPEQHVTLAGSPSKAGAASVVLGAKVDDGHYDYCDTCLGSGRLICCDECPRSFHFHCLNPPLDIDEMPGQGEDDTWKCRVCAAGKVGKVRHRTLFGQLIAQVEAENPTVFTLPPEVRQNFRGVITGSDGSYVNGAALKPLKANKAGLVEERDPYKLRDKNNRPVFCYHCGGSAMPLETPRAPGSSRAAGSSSSAATSALFSRDLTLPTETQLAQVNKNWRSILSCDYCNLHWHLDCLDPPMTSMPSLTKKWKCPGHSENAVEPRRIAKSLQNIELPIPNHRNIGAGKPYTARVRNNGEIDIIPEALDKTFDRQDGSGPSLTPGWAEQIIEMSSGPKFRFKVPEKVIRTDFWNRVRRGADDLQSLFNASKEDAERRGASFVEVREPDYWYQ